MGMGYGASYADVVSDEFVEKTCPNELKELKELKEAIEASDYDWDSFAQEWQYDDGDDEEIESAYIKLTKAFEKITGLGVNICYHDQHDEGDRYDQINGAFWTVDGVYELSKAGKKYENEIDRKLFVSFG